MTWIDRTSSGQAGGPTPLSESSGMVRLEIGAWVAMCSQTKLPSNEFTTLSPSNLGDKIMVDATDRAFVGNNQCGTIIRGCRILK